jgi:hypothetical protein
VSTAHVHGRVVVNGEPAAGFHVWSRHEPQIGMPQATQTLADGTFDFGSVPSGESWLSVATPDDAVRFTRTRHFTTTPDEDKHIEIARDAGFIHGTLTGAVGDTRTLRVFLLPDSDSAVDATDRLLIHARLQTVTPDPDGTFSLGPVVTGAYLMNVERLHDNPRGSECVAEQPTPVVVTKTDTTRVESLVVLAEVTVAGRVELPPDAELSQLVVRDGIWFARSIGADRTGGTALLAKDLTFSLKLVPGEYVVGSHGIDDEPHAEADVVVVPPQGSTDVVIRLRKSGR